MNDCNLSTIPQIRQVYYDTYANLPTTNLRAGALGYATDRLMLYRWSGAAWQNITVYSSAGTAGNRPAAAGLIDGSVYYSTDTVVLSMVSGGAWVDMPSAGGTQAYIMPENYNSIGQGTWAYGVDDALYLNGRFTNTSETNGDNISYKVYLAAGTYTLRFHCLKGNSHGIVDIDIDGVEKASFDLYNAANIINQVISATGIVVAVGGLKTVRLRMDGKNGASSSYRMYLMAFSFWRTA